MRPASTAVLSLAYAVRTGGGQDRADALPVVRQMNRAAPRRDRRGDIAGQLPDGPAGPAPSTSIAVAYMDVPIRSSCYCRQASGR